MARETRSAGIMGDLQRLSVAMEANEDLLPDLEPYRLKLTGIVAQVFEVAKQQAAHKAGKQESSKHSGSSSPRGTGWPTWCARRCGTTSAPMPRRSPNSV